jgi:hypothetical protein
MLSKQKATFFIWALVRAFCSSFVAPLALKMTIHVLHVVQSLPIVKNPTHICSCHFCPEEEGGISMFVQSAKTFSTFTKHKTPKKSPKIADYIQNTCPYLIYTYIMNSLSINFGKYFLILRAYETKMFIQIFLN